MVTATAMNIGALLKGQAPAAQPTWNAICLADFGDSGVAFLAQPQIPPRNVNWSSQGRMGSLRQGRVREILPAQDPARRERAVLRALPARQAQHRQDQGGQDRNMSAKSPDRLRTLRQDQPAAGRTRRDQCPLRLLPSADLQRSSRSRWTRRRSTAISRTATSPSWSMSGRPGAVPAAPWRRCSNGPRSELEPAVRLLKLNSDKAPAVSSRLGISGIPTLLLMSNGREIARTSGAMDTKNIVAWTTAGLARS